MTTCSGGDSFDVDSATQYIGKTNLDGCYELYGSFTVYEEGAYFLDDLYVDGQPAIRAFSSIGDKIYDNVSEALGVLIPRSMLMFCLP